MQKSAKDKHFIKQPWYEGGPKALKQYIAENLRYPAEALATRLEGTVTVRYDINHRGEVIEAHVVGHRLGHGCDEEAIRLVKSLRFQVEAPRGLRVIHHKTMQVHFRLPPAPPAEAAQPQQLQLNYTTPTTPPAADEQKPTQGGGYSYTLTIG